MSTRSFLKGLSESFTVSFIITANHPIIAAHHTDSMWLWCSLTKGEWWEIPAPWNSTAAKPGSIPLKLLSTASSTSSKSSAHERSPWTQVFQYSVIKEVEHRFWKFSPSAILEYWVSSLPSLYLCLSSLFCLFLHRLWAQDCTAKPQATRHLCEQVSSLSRASRQVTSAFSWRPKVTWFATRSTRQVFLLNFSPRRSECMQTQYRHYCLLENSKDFENDPTAMNKGATMCYMTIRELIHLISWILSSKPKRGFSFVSFQVRACILPQLANHPHQDSLPWRRCDGHHLRLDRHIAAAGDADPRCSRGWKGHQ